MDEVSQTIQTYDKIAADYCKKTRQIKYLNWEESYIKKLLDFISKSEPFILDVGCGDGRHCVLIEKSGGRFLGIDLSQAMVEVAKKYYPKGNFRKMDMRKLDFFDNSFDGIWASGSIYHVPKSDLGQVIEEFKRVLTIDGALAINFKLGKGEGMESDPKSYSGSPRYFAYYLEGEMRDIMGTFGFEVLDSVNYPEEIFGDKIQQIWFRLKGK